MGTSFPEPDGAAPISLEVGGMGDEDWGRVLGDTRTEQLIN